MPVRNRGGGGVALQVVTAAGSIVVRLKVAQAGCLRLCETRDQRLLSGAARLRALANAHQPMRVALDGERRVLGSNAAGRRPRPLAVLVNLRVGRVLCLSARSGFRLPEFEGCC